MGEVRGSFVLRMFQTHVQPSDANSSVHLAEGKTKQKGESILDCDLAYKANLRASSQPRNFKLHLPFHKQKGAAPKHGRDD